MSNLNRIYIKLTRKLEVICLGNFYSINLHNLCHLYKGKQITKKRGFLLYILNILGIICIIINIYVTDFLILWCICNYTIWFETLCLENCAFFNMPTGVIYLLYVYKGNSLGCSQFKYSIKCVLNFKIY